MVLILIGQIFTSGISLGEKVNFGTVAMIIGCIFMALYIIIVDNFTKKSDPLLLGMGQMFWIAVIGFLLWSIEEPKTFFSIKYTNELLANIFVLAFFAKAYAYIMLMYCQKYASPISVTIMASTEPVITMVLALLIPNTFGITESLRLGNIVGAVFVVIGAICAGTNFLNSKKSLTRSVSGG